MNTKTTTPTCAPIIVPERSVFLTKGPNQPKNNVGTQNPVEITFDHDRPVTPLEPLVQANYVIYNTGGDVNTVTIQVCAVVFINTSAAPCIQEYGTMVYWNNNFAAPEFFIAYNAPEATSKTFYAYEVHFEISHGTHEANPPIPEITTYLVDQDPVTSRGTKTTVQPPTT